jgi:uncharacterized protein (TIRG00374 family)
MKKSKYFWNLAVILVITILVLYFSLKDNDDQVTAAIQGMSILGLVIVLLWGIGYTIVWGGVYRVLVRKYRPGYTFLEGITVAFVGSFFAGITPSATGGQFGQVYILKKQGVKYADGASILWADFIIYQTTMMIYVTLLFLWKFKEVAMGNNWFLVVLAGYVVNFFVIVSLYTMALFPKFYVRAAGFLAELLAKMHLVKDAERTKISWTSQVDTFTTQIKILSKDKKSILECFFINILRLSLLYSLPYVIAWALGLRLSLSLFFEVIALTCFVSVANSFIPIPGASGGTEVMFSVIFSPLFGSMTTAIMLLWRLSSYYVVILIGGLIFFFATNGIHIFKKRKHHI